MLRICIKNGTIVLRNTLLKKPVVSIAGGKIRSIGRGAKDAAGASIIDARNCFVSPGFIDTHIHGVPGEIFRNEVRYGTTSIVVAESCAPLPALFRKVRSVEEFIVSDPIFGPNVLGVRLEGPYISKVRSGAQDKRYIRKPALNELSGILKKSGALLKIMTLAPELEGVIPLIKLLGRRGVVASMGHTDASYDEALKGVDAGIGHATHLPNAMRKTPPLAPSSAAFEALVDERVAVEVIADLIHVGPALFRLIVNLKGADKAMLITDSVRADLKSGMKKSGGVYRFRDGRIAGSCLTMIEAVKNAVRAGGLSLADAVRMASFNPAKLLGVQHRKGSIAAGKDADIVIFDKDFDVKMTIVGGEIVFGKKEYKLA